MQKVTSEQIAQNLGFPILFLILSVFWTIWFALELKRKTLNTKLTINWLILNIFSLTLSIYLFIIGIINSSPLNIDPAFNFVNFLTWKIFGIETNLAWILWVVIIISATAINLAIKLTVRMSNLNKKVDELNRTVAILKGKLVNNFDYENQISTAELTLDEYKKILEDKLAKEKARIKTQKKLEQLQERYSQNTEQLEEDFSTSKLLGLDPKVENSVNKNDGDSNEQKNK